MSEHTFSPIKMDHQEKYRMYIGSFWIFIIAEAMMFVTLFSSRFLLAGTMKSNELNQATGIISTIIVLISVFTVQRALQLIKAGQFQGSARHLNITAFFGVVVLLMNGFEWFSGSFDWGSRFGEVYYIITLFHELHLLGGIVAAAAIAIHAKKGSFSSESFWPVKAIQVYWIFVAIIWVCVYLGLYLI